MSPLGVGEAVTVESLQHDAAIVGWPTLGVDCGLMKVEEGKMNVGYAEQ
jgi:hypothetical protein